MDDRCFACGRAFRLNSAGRMPFHPQALTEDGAQRVFVGMDCWKKIAASGTAGYQPPQGGPRLYCDIYAPADALRVAGITITHGRQWGKEPS